MREMTIEDRIRKLGICKQPGGVRPILGASLAFPDRLRTVQERLGARTDKEFAEKIGVSRPTMSAYLRGNQYPRKQVLHRMATLGGVSIEWLTNGPQAPRQQIPGTIPADGLDIDVLADAIVDAIVRRLSA